MEGDGASRSFEDYLAAVEGRVTTYVDELVARLLMEVRRWLRACVGRGGQRRSVVCIRSLFSFCIVWLCLLRSGK